MAAAKRHVYDVAIQGQRAERPGLRTTTTVAVQASSEAEAKALAIRAAKSGGWIDPTAYACAKKFAVKAHRAGSRTARRTVQSAHRAGEVPGSQGDFMGQFFRFANLHGKFVRFDGRNQFSNTYDTVLVTFVNLPTPEVEGRHDGARTMNHRQIFSISGFNRHDPAAAAPGKLTIKTLSAWPYPRLRGMTGTPAAVAKALAAHLTKIASEDAPHRAGGRAARRASSPEEWVVSEVNVTGADRPRGMTRAFVTIKGKRFEFVRLFSSDRYEVYDFPRSYEGLPRFVGYTTAERAEHLDTVLRRWIKDHPDPRPRFVRSAVSTHRAGSRKPGKDY